MRVVLANMLITERTSVVAKKTKKSQKKFKRKWMRKAIKQLRRTLRMTKDLHKAFRLRELREGLESSSAKFQEQMRDHLSSEASTSLADYNGPSDEDFPDKASLRQYYLDNNFTMGQALNLAANGLTPFKVFGMTPEEIRRPYIADKTIDKLMLLKGEWTKKRLS